MPPIMIWLSKGGQRQGPMPITDAQARIASGEYQQTDLAWIVGTPTWTSIAQCSQLAADPYNAAPPAMPPGQSEPAEALMPGWLPHTSTPISWARFGARYLDRSLIALLITTIPRLYSLHE